MGEWTTLPNGVCIKDYEVGVTLADKCKYIRWVGEITQSELSKVLGYNSNEVHYIEGGWIPDKNVITVINKLYRLWHEIADKREKPKAV